MRTYDKGIRTDRRVVRRARSVSKSNQRSEDHGPQGHGASSEDPRLFQRLAQNEQVEKRHLSAEEVYKLLLNDDCDIGLATVYRVLTQFESAGILVRHHFDEGRATYELQEGHHHDHIVCVRCGKLEEFVDPAIEQAQRVVAGRSLRAYRSFARPLRGVRGVPQGQG